MDMVYGNNKELFFFVVVKLLEIGLVNMYWIEILWRFLIGYLFEFVSI